MVLTTPLSEGEDPEQQEELAEAVLGAHQVVADEEERDPLEVLAEAADDLHRADGVGVGRLDQDQEDEGDNPARERRQPHLLAADDDPHQDPDADRRDHQVAQAGDQLVVRFQLDDAVQQAEVEDQDRQGDLVAGAGGQGDQAEHPADDPDGEEEVRVGDR